MKTMKQLFILIVLISTTTIFGCKKEGCTDKDSVNYDPDAKKSDNSCQYEGTIVFWYDQATSTFLVNDGATALTYYVDGSVVGSSATSVYWTGAPNCGQSSSVTVKKSLGGVKSKSSTYSIKDQTGFEYYTGTVQFQANTCTSYQLQ